MTRTTALILVATVVVLVIVIAFAMSRRSTPSPGPCGAGCPPPTTCVAGVCVDQALPALLSAAQTSAAQLYSGLGGVLPAIHDIPTHLRSLQNAATAMGLTPIPAQHFTAMQFELGAVADGATKYMNLLSVPGCQVRPGATCGYQADIASMTPATPPSQIDAAASAAMTAAAVAPLVLRDFTAAGNHLGDIASLVVASAADKKVAFDTATATAYTQVSADVATLFAMTQALQVLADNMRDAGLALANHL